MWSSKFQRRSPRRQSHDQAADLQTVFVPWFFLDCQNFAAPEGLFLKDRIQHETWAELPSSCFVGDCQSQTGPFPPPSPFFPTVPCKPSWDPSRGSCQRRIKQTSRFSRRNLVASSQFICNQGLGLSASTMGSPHRLVLLVFR